MKKKDINAIKSLKRHKSKLSDRNNFNSAWISKLSDMLLKYLGKDSQLYKSTVSWYSFAQQGNQRHIDNCLQILESAIEYIEDNGIIKEIGFWRTIENTNKVVVYSAIIFITTCIFSLGFIIGDIRQTKVEYNLLQENKSLKDSLSTIKVNIDKTNEKINTDTTTNQHSEDNK